MKFNEIDKLIKQTHLAKEWRSKLIGYLEQSSEYFESLPQNRDGRGVRHKIHRQVAKTIRHIDSALKMRKQHQDPQVRHRAEKLLRSIPHHQKNFQTLASLASRFRGTVNSASFKLNEQIRQKNARQVDISSSLSLQEVHSKSLLQKVGRQLSLCVANGYDADQYMGDVKEGSIELWIICKAQEVVGVLQVDIEARQMQRIRRRQQSRREPSCPVVERTITECNGYNNEPLELSRNVALKILESLQINNVSVTTFSRVGAFPMFLQEDLRQMVPEPIFDGEELHYVWKVTDCITIATSSKQTFKQERFVHSKMKWSGFKLQPKESFREEEDTEKHLKEWLRLGYENYLSVGSLLNLALTNPSFYRVLSKF